MTNWFVKYLIEEPDWRERQSQKKTEDDGDFMKTQEVKG